MESELTNQFAGQVELDLEGHKPIHPSLFTKGELRAALLAQLPPGAKVRRAEVLDKAAMHLGLAHGQARAQLNLVIAEERREGRLKTDGGGNMCGGWRRQIDAERSQVGFSPAVQVKFLMLNGLAHGL